MADVKMEFSSTKVKNSYDLTLKAKGFDLSWLKGSTTGDVSRDRPPNNANSVYVSLETGKRVAGLDLYYFAALLNTNFGLYVFLPIDPVQLYTERCETCHGPERLGNRDTGGWAPNITAANLAERGYNEDLVIAKLTPPNTLDPLPGIDPLPPFAGSYRGSMSLYIGSPTDRWNEYQIAAVAHWLIITP